MPEEPKLRKAANQWVYRMLKGVEVDLDAIEQSLYEALCLIAQGSRATLAAKDKRIQELETALRWIRADAKTNLNHLVEVIDREVGDA